MAAPAVTCLVSMEPLGPRYGPTTSAAAGLTTTLTAITVRFMIMISALP
jgi:hypothetical protein